MRVRAPFLSALVALVAAPATAGAATIATTATQVLYTGAATDRISMVLSVTADTDFGGAQAAFFLPTDATIVDPTTTDPNCMSRPTGASSCRLPAGGDIRVTTQGENDFLNIGSAGSLVTFEAGAGDDRVFVTSATRLNALGQGGNDTLQGSTGIDSLDGGPGDDTLDPRGISDVVVGGSGFDTVRMPSGGVVVSLDDAANDGAAGDGQNIHSDVEKVVGGDGGDALDGSAGPNTLDGGDGSDTINGLGGADALLGGNGDDVIVARDGAADTVTCGAGADRAAVDPADTVSPDCETVTLPDSDGDGVTAPADCDDGNAAIRPGVVDLPGNGVDEDCSGADAPAPAVAAPAPIGGGRPASSTPPPGPAVAVAVLPRVDARVVDRWIVGVTGTRVRELTVTGAPAGATVAVNCRGRGCAFRRVAVTAGRGPVRLARLFKGRRLRRGTVVEVAITAPGRVGRVIRFTVRAARKRPATVRLCLAPGARTPRACAAS